MLIAIAIMPLSSCSAHNIENKVKGLALSLATAYKQTNEKKPQQPTSRNSREDNETRHEKRKRPTTSKKSTAEPKTATISY